MKFGLVIIISVMIIILYEIQALDKRDIDKIIDISREAVNFAFNR